MLRCIYAPGGHGSSPIQSSRAWSRPRFVSSKAEKACHWRSGTPAGSLSARRTENPAWIRASRTGPDCNLSTFMLVFFLLFLNWSISTSIHRSFHRCLELHFVRVSCFRCPGSWSGVVTVCLTLVSVLSWQIRKIGIFSSCIISSHHPVFPVFRWLCLLICAGKSSELKLFYERKEAVLLHQACRVVLEFINKRWMDERLSTD